MTFRIDAIQPNPYRNMDHYPIRPEKVEALVESLRVTGFWDNVVARLNDDGNPEIAYGHHRLAALREAYSPDHEVSLIIKPLSDDDMAQIMARENMDEWGSNAMVEQETVKAILDGYARGELNLPAPPPKSSQTRMVGAGNDHPYTAETLAEYAGWYTVNGKPNVGKVKVALRGLDLIDNGLASEDDFAGLSTRAAQATTAVAEGIVNSAEVSAQSYEKSGKPEAAKVIRENAEKRARKAVKAAVAHVEHGGGARDIASAVRKQNLDSDAPPPDLNDFIGGITRRVNGLLQDESKLFTDMMEAFAYREFIEPEKLERLAHAFETLAIRATQYQKKVGGGE